MLQDEEKIISLLSEPLKIAGFDLVEVTIGMLNAQKKIQLYIDSPNGIQIDDCVNVNQITKNIFGKTNQHYKDYLLEVSSPGIFRKLKTPDHFKSSTGKRIKVHLQKKIDGLMTVTGDLQKCDEDTIWILPDTNGSDMIIPYSIISRANLEPLLKF
jgi:ribosome maturation factor RimP